MLPSPRQWPEDGHQTPQLRDAARAVPQRSRGTHNRHPVLLCGCEIGRDWATACSVVIDVHESILSCAKQKLVEGKCVWSCLSPSSDVAANLDGICWQHRIHCHLAIISRGHQQQAVLQPMGRVGSSGTVNWTGQCLGQGEAKTRGRAHAQRIGRRARKMRPWPRCRPPPFGILAVVWRREQTSGEPRAQERSA